MRTERDRDGGAEAGAGLDRRPAAPRSATADGGCAKRRPKGGELLHRRDLKAELEGGLAPGLRVSDVGDGGARAPKDLKLHWRHGRAAPR